MIRCADTHSHSLVTGNMPFPVLVDTKFWDVTKYCSVVPSHVQNIPGFVDPFPTDKIKSISHTCPEEFLP